LIPGEFLEIRSASEAMRGSGRRTSRASLRPSLSRPRLSTRSPPYSAPFLVHHRNPRGARRVPRARTGGFPTDAVAFDRAPRAPRRPGRNVRFPGEPGTVPVIRHTRNRAGGRLRRGTTPRPARASSVFVLFRERGCSLPRRRRRRARLLRRLRGGGANRRHRLPRARAKRRLRRRASRRRRRACLRPRRRCRRRARDERYGW